MEKLLLDDENVTNNNAIADDGSISAQWQKMADEVKAEEKTRFPNVTINQDDEPSVMVKKQDMVWAWIADNTNADGSWKKDNIDVPADWMDFVVDSIEAKKNLWNMLMEKRAEEIEWIETSKQMSKHPKKWLQGDEYLRLSDEQQDGVQNSMDKIAKSVEPFAIKTNSLRRIEALDELMEHTAETIIQNYGSTINVTVADAIAKQIQKIADVASEHFPDDGQIRISHTDLEDEKYTEEDTGFATMVEGGAKDLATALKVAEFNKNSEMINTYMNTIAKNPLLKLYATIHYLDDEKIKTFFTNVVPLIDEKNPEVQSLLDNSGIYDGWAGRGGNTFGKQFGNKDFTICALISEVNPANTQELLLAYREASASEYANYEQNRIDACKIGGVLIGSRRFIHGENPGEHEILASMLKFYETKDDPKEHIGAETELRKIQEKYDGVGYYYNALDDDYIFNLDNYEKNIDETEEKAVDVLRRLVKNTDPKILEKPEVQDLELSGLIQNMQLTINERSGQSYVNFREVGQIVKRVNELLNERQGKIGFKPSEIKSLAFIERIATFAMRNTDKGDWRELPFDPNFKEICRFAELTSQSDSYNESDFENFWQKFTRIKDFDDEHELIEHYRMLSSRRLSQLSQLPKKSPFLKREADALWSGNLNNELIRLVDGKK